MPRNSLWDLTYRPYTLLKLKILEKYLQAWASIFFSTATRERGWKKYQEMYYIDCFAGRGKYHKDGKKNIIDGSPLISLKCASEFQKKQKNKGVKMNCIFVEINKRLSGDIGKFCGPYTKRVDFEIHRQKDFNVVISQILDKIDGHPAFFFIDPDGIKGLKKESLKRIVARRGPTDILLNYIKGGVERITGLTKKRIPNILDQNLSVKDIKTIKVLTDFYGLEIFKNLDKTERERLKDWTKSLLENTNLKQIAVFNMPYLHKTDNIYYLLFASRKIVAKKIMLNIFKNAKKETYQKQKRLDIFNTDEFEL